MTDSKISKNIVQDEIVQHLGFEPTPFFILPNANIAITSSKSNVLKIYDSDFTLVKTIDKINNKTFSPRYLISNCKSSIYLTDGLNSQIIQTDLDFNFIKQFGSKGSSNQQLDNPCGIEFYENSVYVCDKENKRIQKLSEDLVFQESYPLNFKPENIKITKNVACIRSAVSGYLSSLYQLNPFSFKTRMGTRDSEIYSINSWFYVFNELDERIECYDINGNLVGVDSFVKIFEDSKQLHSFGYFNNNWLIIGRKKK